MSDYAMNWSSILTLLVSNRRRRLVCDCSSRSTIFPSPSSSIVFGESGLLRFAAVSETITALGGPAWGGLIPSKISSISVYDKLTFIYVLQVQSHNSAFKVWTISASRALRTDMKGSSLISSFIIKSPPKVSVWSEDTNPNVSLLLTLGNTGRVITAPLSDFLGIELKSCAIASTKLKWWQPSVDATNLWATPVLFPWEAATRRFRRNTKSCARAV